MIEMTLNAFKLERGDVFCTKKEVLAFKKFFWLLKSAINKKNYERYNNERKEQVFASNSKFQIQRFI